MAGELSQGCIARLSENDTRGALWVQVIALKVLGGGQLNRRHRLEISDGNFSMTAMLATQLNGIVEDGQIALNSVIRIHECVVNLVQQRQVCIILEAEAVHNPRHQLGSPVRWDGLTARKTEQETALDTAVRRLSAVTISRPILPAPCAHPPPALLGRPTSAGPLCWLPFSGRLAGILEPCFVQRVAHVFEVDVKYPRVTEGLVALASRAHAALAAAPIAAAPTAAGPTAAGPTAAAPQHTPLALLPGELLCLVVQQHVERDWMLPLALSCLALRDAVYISLARTSATLSTRPSSAVLAGPSYASWAVTHARCPLGPLCRAAAASGRLEAVEWAVGVGSPWTGACAVDAARAGAADVLEWAAQKGLLAPLTEETSPHFAELQAAARAHTQRIFGVLRMEEADMQRYRNRLAAERAIERHREERAATAAAAAYAAAAVHVDMTEVMPTDVRTLVRAFFLGAEMGDDDEQYPSRGRTDC